MKKSFSVIMALGTVLNLGICGQVFADGPVDLYGSLKGVYDSGTAMTVDDLPDAGILATKYITKQTFSLTSQEFAFIKQKSSDGSVKLLIHELHNPDAASADTLANLASCGFFFPYASQDNSAGALITWNSATGLRESEGQTTGILQGIYLWRTAIDPKTNQKIIVDRFDFQEPGCSMLDTNLVQQPFYETEALFGQVTSVKAMQPSALSNPTCDAFVNPFQWTRVKEPLVDCSINTAAGNAWNCYTIGACCEWVHRY